MNSRQPGISRRALLGGFAAAGGAAAAAAGMPPAAAGAPRASAAVQESATASTLFTLAPSGAWCWFGDPRAIHHRGSRRRTYVGYITAGGDIRVTQYDHVSGQSTTSVLASGFQVDDHNTPSIIVRPDGRLVVFWSGHSGPRMYYRRSVAAEDVSAGWEPVATIPTNTEGEHGYTYPNPVALPAEDHRLYLFWRGGNYNPTWSATEDTRQWSDASTLIRVDGERPYVKVASNGDDTIHFAFTDGHPRNVDTSIYHMYYRSGSLHRSDGTRIGPLTTPVAPEQATKVYDFASTGAKSWVHDIACDRQGRPVITFARFPADDDHRYHYAWWDGSAWTDHEMTAAGGTISEDPAEPHYSGGITLDHTDPAKVLLSRRVGGANEIERWTTPDHGTGWRREPVTTGSAETQVRPITPRGLSSDDPLGIIWMSGRYPSYTEFQTGIRSIR